MTFFRYIRPHLRALVITVLGLTFGVFGSAQTPTLGEYTGYTPRYDCGSQAPHDLSQMFFTLTITSLEQNRAAGTFSTGATYTDSSVDGTFDLPLQVEGGVLPLQGIIVTTENMMGSGFVPYKLELVWNPLIGGFEGLVTNLSPLRCEDGTILNNMLFVQLTQARG
ncbi:MAG: hypothetical protein AAF267_18615 [Deinococcota bacterium]